MDLFQSLFSNFEGNFARQQQPPSNKPPPASSKAMSSLPNVQVTADDLLEETNKECAICLDDQRIGKMACKLPCGHLFHRPCVLSWLEKQCTCPTCRFELETSDPVYERQRKERMQSRKIRVRIDELQAKKISELRTLCRSLQIDISTCVDKRDIIEKIQDSAKVTITQGAPPTELREEDFLSKSVSELKHLLLSFGLSPDGALEKAELRNRLLVSGRIIIVSQIAIESTSQPVSSAKTIVQKVSATSTIVADNVDLPGISHDSLAAKSSAVATAAESASDDNTQQLITIEELLRSMPLAALRQLSKDHNVSLADCVEREDVIQNLLPCVQHFGAASSSPSPTSASVLQPHTSVPASPPVPVSTTNGNAATFSSASSSSYSSSAAASSSSASPHSLRITLSRSVLDALPLQELRAVLEAYDVDTSSCLERHDLFELLSRAPEIHLVE